MKNSYFLIFCQILISENLSQIGFTQVKNQPIQVSSDLQLIPIKENLYIHKSWSVFPEFGRVASNGLIYANNKKGIIMDTPANDSLTLLLANWIKLQITGRKGL